MIRTFRPHADVTVLHDQAEIPGLGVLPVNAFVLHAEQPVVVDTGLGLPDRDFVAELAQVMDPADVRWIWLTHPDRDHTGGLFNLLEAAPNARVVTTFIGVGILSCETPLPMDRIYLLNAGQSLDVGDRQLTGFRPPLWDNPATVGFFDSRTGVCFSSDCFGAPLASTELAAVDDVAGLSADELLGAQLLWASVDSPWVHDVDRTKFAASFTTLREHQSSWLFSTHLPPIPGTERERLLDNISRTPDATRFMGPDQAALELMLASFEPQEA
jgi:hypothetical protein